MDPRIWELDKHMPETPKVLKRKKRALKRRAKKAVVGLIVAAGEVAKSQLDGPSLKRAEVLDKYFERKPKPTVEEE